MKTSLTTKSLVGILITAGIIALIIWGENIFSPNSVSTQNSLKWLPKDPGYKGKKTVLGIDSDNDGIRDDLQLQIHLKFPDSPNARAAYLYFAKSIRIVRTKYLENPSITYEEILPYDVKATLGLELLHDNDGFYRFPLDDFIALMNNTGKRLLLTDNIDRLFNGRILPVLIKGIKKYEPSYNEGMKDFNEILVVQQRFQAQKDSLQETLVDSQKSFRKLPKNPGSQGKKTILGIDSDNDGIRDDLQIQIHFMLPNSPQKRSAYILLSRAIQKKRKYFYDNPTTSYEELLPYEVQVIIGLKFLRQYKADSEYPFIEYLSLLNNTRERTIFMQKLHSIFNSRAISITNNRSQKYLDTFAQAVKEFDEICKVAMEAQRN